MDFYTFMIERLHDAMFWAIVWIVLLAVFGGLMFAVGKIPVFGAIVCVPLIMLLLHSMLALYGFLHVIGCSESTALWIPGIVVLFIVFLLAWWVAADNVRKGTYGL